MRFQPAQCHHDVVVGESDALSLAGGSSDERVAAAVSGEFGACDVWFRGPAAWLESAHRVIARLYARHGDARVSIGEVHLYDTVHSVDSNGIVSAWVFAARGVPAQAFEVTYQRGAEGAALSDGQLFLRAGNQSGEPTLLAQSGVAGLKSMTVSNVVQVQPTGPVTVTQTQASGLQATVVQSSPSALQATVSQTNASALQATVLQSNAASLQATVVQSSPSALQATVSQSNAASLQPTGVQSGPSWLFLVSRWKSWKKERKHAGPYADTRLTRETLEERAWTLDSIRYLEPLDPWTRQATR